MNDMAIEFFLVDGMCCLFFTDLNTGAVYSEGTADEVGPRPMDRTGWVLLPMSTWVFWLNRKIVRIKRVK